MIAALTSFVRRCRLATSSWSAASPQISFFTSPSPFSALGFLLGIAAFHVVQQQFKPCSVRGVVLYRFDASHIACGTSLSSNRCFLMILGNHSATMASTDAWVPGDAVQREDHDGQWARRVSLK